MVHKSKIPVKLVLAKFLQKKKKVNAGVLKKLCAFENEKY